MQKGAPKSNNLFRRGILWRKYEVLEWFYSHKRVNRMTFWHRNNIIPKMLFTVVAGEEDRIVEVWGYKIELLVKQPDARVCSNMDGWWPCLSLAWLNIYTAVSSLEHIDAGLPPCWPQWVTTTRRHQKQTRTICSDWGTCGWALMNMAEQ